MSQQTLVGFRLSPQQRRLWLDQLSGEGMFCAQVAVLLEGSLEDDDLFKALLRVVARHEALRTTFHRLRAMKFPVQVIAEEPALSWRIVDSRVDKTHAQESIVEESIIEESIVEEILEQERAQPFDFERGPLLRSALVRCFPDRHFLIITLPALCADSFSLGRIVEELGECYEESQQRAEPEETPVQFVQVSEWQNELLESEESEQGKAYWRRQAAQSPIIPRAPFEENADEEKASVPRVFISSIAPDLCAKLEILASVEKTSLDLLLFACWQTLLWRLTQQSPLMIGKVFDFRKYNEFEECIGPLSGWVPVTSQWDERAPFKKVLQQVREAAQDAYEWQDYFVAEEYLASQPEGGDSLKAPVLFEYREQAAKRYAGGLSWTICRQYQRTDTFKLKLGCARSGETLNIELGYDANVYDEESVRRLAANYAALLSSIVAGPNVPASRLELLGDAERRQLLAGFRETSPGRFSQTSIHSLFEQQAASTPGRQAIVSQHQRLTYAELNERSNQLAHLLRSRAVIADDRIGLCMERSAEIMIALLGILKAGGAYVPLDPEHPAQRLAGQLSEASVRVLVTQEKMRHLFADFTGEIICLDSSSATLEEQPRTNLQSSTGPQNLAYVLYTSGSTGQPKGVAVSHESLINYTLSICQTLSLADAHADEGLNFANVTTFTADLGNTSIFPSLVSGGCLHLISQELATDGIGFAAYLSEQRIDVLKIVPSHFSALLSEGGAQAMPRRYLILGGEALSYELVRRIRQLPVRCRIVNHYGPTEATVGSLTYTLQDEEVREPATTTVPLGKPVANTQVYILDQEMGLLPFGVSGELYIGGSGLARGYLGQPEQTARQFVPHPFASVPGARLYKTGDRVRYTRDGNIEFLGRLDQQVKLRGYRIELGEIAAALLKHEAVRDAVVIACGGANGASRLAAFVVPDGPVNREELSGFLSALLPNYMLPASFSFIQALPLTRNGKIDRQALPSPDELESHESREYVAPRTSAEEILAGIWQQVLGLERVSVHDNFFELGGDSILSIQLISRANRAGLQLTTRQVFQHQTIAALAMVTGTTPTVEAEQGAVNGPVPLTPIQHRFFETHTVAPHHYNQSVLLEAHRAVNLSLLEEAVRRLSAHHDVLRLRFQRGDAGWQQFNVESEESLPVGAVDLSALSETEQKTLIETSAAQSQASLNLTRGPLLRILLFNLGTEKHARLLIVIHHLAVDGVSWRILLEDLQALYLRLLHGEAAALPPKTTSFRQWSQRLNEYASSVALRQEASYWLSEPRLHVPRLLLDYEGGVNAVASIRDVKVQLSEEETRALLQDVPAAYRTQINDVLLTALVQSFGEWTGEPALLLGLEGHGREEILADVDVTRTVGWFTSYFPLLLSVAGDADEAGAIKGIKEQLREVKNQGIGYGLLRYASGDEELMSRLRSYPQPEVSFNYLGQLDQVLAETPLFTVASESSEPNRSPLDERAHLLEIEGGIFKGKLQLSWSYSANLHRRETIESLAANYLKALRRLIAHCRAGQSPGYTASDFPLAQLGQEQLEQLLGDEPGIADIYPLSPMQQGMLFHSLYEPDSGDYVVQISCELHGGLNVPAFVRAWQHVVERHAILRTFFAWERLSEPLQVVRRRVTLPIEQQDWRGLSSSEQRERLAEFLGADRARWFDLRQAPLMRLALVHLSDDLHHFVWSNHHLIIDGWCRPMILKEVFACYEAFSRGEDVRLEPARQFRDYIAWLRQQEMSEAETFWRRKLKDFRAPTRLDPEPGQQLEQDRAATYREQRLQLSADETAALTSLARSRHLTLNTLIQGAWALLLGRYSGTEDVVFGVTVSGRPANLEGSESIIGLFINTLPLRVQMPPGDSLVRWLKELQDQQSLMRQYEYTPLIQVHGWSEVPRRLPLFESMLVFNNYPVGEYLEEQTKSLGLWGYRSINWSTVYSNYPLIIVTGPARELMLRFTYDSARFSDATMMRIIEDLRVLLTAMVEQPGRQLIELRALGNLGTRLPVASDVQTGDELEYFNFEL
jgi:amino acid adenylation domain-containing protein/non-ribosomal peptide synthase protein (TIGR01720 family)